MTRTGRPLAMPAEERKKEVHVAAEKLFGERGHEQVTMSEIAAQAGTSKKTLYAYFSDKEARSEEHTTELQSLMSTSYAVGTTNQTTTRSLTISSSSHVL